MHSTMMPLRSRATAALVAPGWALHTRLLTTLKRNRALEAATKPPAAPAPAPLNFNDGRSSFQSKSRWELVRALMVFQVSSFKPFVRNSAALLAAADSVLPRSLVDWALKGTFFGHFCAGEDGESIRPVVNKLKAANIGSILDYAAEADVGASKRKDVGAGERHELQSRTYDYTGEEVCDLNLDISLKAIQAAAESKGFAAVKMTALGRPELLQHLTLIIKETRAHFIAFNNSAAKGDTSGHRFTLDSFRQQAGFVHAGLSDDEISKLFHAVDVDHSGSVDFIDWLDFVEPLRLCTVPVSDPRWSLLLTPSSQSTMAPEEVVQFAAMLRRLDTLAIAADEAGVTLMVDAEQTYMQPAIDHCVQYMQRKYNTRRAVVYDTVQCYLLDSKSRLEVSVRRASRHGFKYGVKVVRGAYLVQETALAQAAGVPCAIWPNITATHANYNACVGFLLDCLPAVEFMVASHNEETVRFVVDEMKLRGVHSLTGGVSFGQLLGMCDHVSFPLGRAGYRVLKYVPYGPVREVVPYLVRRAQENSDLLGRVGKERRLLATALLARLA